MAKIPTRLAMVLVAAACGGAPALAQPRGVAAAPAPHITAPAVPHVSAPAPHIAVSPRFNPAPHIAPHAATPRFSTRAPSVHQFTPRGHGLAGRGFARHTVRGPALSRHALAPSTRSASRKLPGRDLTRRATRTTGRSTARERALAKNKLPTGNPSRVGNDRTRVAEPKNRPRAAAPAGRNRLSRAQFAALSHPLGERNRNDSDRHRWFHERRRFRHGGFVGWFGPVFWPYAYDDFFDYAFWPYEYDDYGFWAYAYDDVFDDVFFTPGTEDVYASVGGGYGNVGRSGGRAERRQGREVSRGAAELCRTDPGLTRWPIDQIAQAVEPTRQQQQLLDDLKSASERAAKLLQTACPAHPPSTPLGRIDAMDKRLGAMLQALDVVRPALAKFYDSLSDEQKARFNAMGRQQSAGGKDTANDEARLCRTQAPAGLTDEAMNRIEQEVRPEDRQKGDLDGLRDAAAKAADILHDACPSQTPLTPVARLDAMANHVKAMLDAINTVRPALARFYDTLSDEQKAHFNVMIRSVTSNQ
jgi:hypothetical protein